MKTNLQKTNSPHWRFFKKMMLLGVGLMMVCGMADAAINVATNANWSDLSIGTTDDVVISAKLTMNNDVSRTCNSITINNGGELTWSNNSSGSLTVTGDFTINSGGRFTQVNNNCGVTTIGGNFTNNGGTYNVGGGTAAGIEIIMTGAGTTFSSTTDLAKIIRLTINLSSATDVLNLDANLSFGDGNAKGILNLTRGVLNANGKTITFVKEGEINVTGNGSFASVLTGCEYKDKCPNIVINGDGNGTVKGTGIIPVNNITLGNGNFPQNTGNVTLVVYGTANKTAGKDNSQGTWKWGPNSNYTTSNTTNQPSPISGAGGPAKIASVANGSYAQASALPSTVVTALTACSNACASPTYTAPVTTAYSACIGGASPATLTLSTVSNSTAIQWYRVASSLTSAPADDSGATAVGTANSNTLAIPTGTAGTFKYYAKITNACGGSKTTTTVRTSLSGIITINDLPTITAPAVSGADGTTAATLTYTTATGTPTQYKITWASGITSDADYKTLDTSPAAITLASAPATPNTYSGTIQVKTAGGCVSTPVAITANIIDHTTIDEDAAYTCTAVGNLYMILNQYSGRYIYDNGSDAKMSTTQHTGRCVDFPSDCGTGNTDAYVTPTGKPEAFWVLSAAVGTYGTWINYKTGRYLTMDVNNTVAQGGYKVTTTESANGNFSNWRFTGTNSKGGILFQCQGGTVSGKNNTTNANANAQGSYNDTQTDYNIGAGGGAQDNAWGTKGWYMPAAVTNPTDLAVLSVIASKASVLLNGETFTATARIKNTGTVNIPNTKTIKVKFAFNGQYFYGTHTTGLTANAEVDVQATIDPNALTVGAKVTATVNSDNNILFESSCANNTATSANVAVIESAAPCTAPSSVGITGTQYYYIGATNALLTANATGGSGSVTTYQWYADGSPISGATSQTYAPPTALPGEVQYTCKVSKGTGCDLTSGDYAVTVNPKITIKARKPASWGVLSLYITAWNSSNATSFLAWTAMTYNDCGGWYTYDLPAEAYSSSAKIAFSCYASGWSTNDANLTCDVTGVSNNPIQASTTYVIHETQDWNCTGAIWRHGYDIVGDPITTGFTLNAGKNPICTGETTTLTLSGTTQNHIQYTLHKPDATTDTKPLGSNPVAWTGIGAAGAYTVTNEYDCSTVGTLTLTVNSERTVAVDANTANRSLCQNTAIGANIVFNTTGVTGITSSTNLPTGVTAAYLGDKITISGTPTVNGAFNYIITPTSACGAATATGTITVYALPAVPTAVATLNGNAITITWAGGNNGNIYRSVNGGEYALLVNNQASGYADNTIVSSNSYTYKVAAVSSNSCVSAQSAATAAIPYCNLTPYNATPFGTNENIIAGQFDLGGIGCAFVKTGTQSNGDTKNKRTDDTPHNTAFPAVMDDWGLQFTEDITWVVYTVNVTEERKYTIETSAKTDNNGVAVAYEIYDAAGTLVDNQFSFSINKSGWSNYILYTSDHFVVLPVGTYQVRMKLTGGSNVQWFRFVQACTPAVNVTVSPLAQNICSGGSATINISNLQANASYALYEGDTKVADGSNSFTVSNITANKTYTVKTLSTTTDVCLGKPVGTATVSLKGVNISTQPAGKTYAMEDIPTPLSVTAAGTNGATISGYQWYTTTDNTAGNGDDQVIPGATSATYTPPTNAVSAGTKYFVKISYDCGAVYSSIATIIVTAQTTPTVNCDKASGGGGFTPTGADYTPSGIGVYGGGSPSISISGGVITGGQNILRHTQISANINYQYIVIKAKGLDVQYLKVGKESSATTSPMAGQTYSSTDFVYVYFEQSIIRYDYVAIALAQGYTVTTDGIWLTNTPPSSATPAEAPDFTISGIDVSGNNAQAVINSITIANTDGDVAVAAPTLAKPITLYVGIGGIWRTVTIVSANGIDIGGSTTYNAGTDFTVSPIALADGEYTINSKVQGNAAEKECTNNDYNTEKITITSCTAPAKFTVSGGGTVCSTGGKNSTTVTLNGSQTGVTYTLDGVNKAGTGSALTWTVSAAGIYTATAVFDQPTAEQCSNAVAMNGSATVTQKNCQLEDPDVTPENEDCGLMLNWTDAGNEDVLHYEIWVNATPSGSPTVCGTNPSLFATIASSPYNFPESLFEDGESKTINFYVKAISKNGDEYNSTGEHCHEIIISQKVEAPVLSAVATDSTIVLTWNAITNASSYTIERQTDAGTWTFVASTTKTTYTEYGTTVSVNTNYTYRVRAKSKCSAAFSEYSNEQTVKIPLKGVCTTEPWEYYKWYNTTLVATGGKIHDAWRQAAYKDNSVVKYDTIPAINYDHSTGTKEGCIYHFSSSTTNGRETGEPNKTSRTVDGKTAYTIDNVSAGDWFLYTINVTEEGYYTFSAKTAADKNGDNNSTPTLTFDILNNNMTSVLTETERTKKMVVTTVGTGKDGSNNYYFNVFTSGQVYLTPGEYKMKVKAGGSIILHSFWYDKICFSVSETGTVPKSVIDAVWEQASVTPIRYAVRLTDTDYADGREYLYTAGVNDEIPPRAGEWRVMYDKDSLYFLITVYVDGPLLSGANKYDGDVVEIYFGGGGNVHQIGYRPKDNARYYYGDVSAAAQAGIKNTFDLDNCADSRPGETFGSYKLFTSIPWIATGYEYADAIAATSISMEIVVNQPTRSTYYGVMPAWRNGGSTGTAGNRHSQLASFPKARRSPGGEYDQMFRQSNLYTSVDLFAQTTQPEVEIRVNEDGEIIPSATIFSDYTWKYLNDDFTEEDGDWKLTENGRVLDNGKPIIDKSYIIRAQMKGCISNFATKIVNGYIIERADTIVWVGDENGSIDWHSRKNWLNHRTHVTLNSRTKFSNDLTVVIPAPIKEHSRYFTTYDLTKHIKPNVSYYTPAGIVKYPEIADDRDAGFVSDDNTLSHIKKLIVEDGAAIQLKPFAGKYDTVHFEFVVLDRNEWILVGPNINPYYTNFEEKKFDTRNTNNMISGDFYLNHEPVVYMRKLNISDDQASWGVSFPELTNTLNANEGFAIRIPNEYGPGKLPSRLYYKVGNPALYYGSAGTPEQIASGTLPVKYTFVGKLGNETVTLPIETAAIGDWKVACNPFAANIDIAKLKAQLGASAQIKVWNWATSSAADILSPAGSFESASTGYIRPMQAFMYCNTAADNLKEIDIVTINSVSTRYRARSTEGRKPTLQINASNGKYGSNAYVVYDDELLSSAFSPEKDLLKLFVGAEYSQTPDGYFTNDDWNLETQTIASLYDEAYYGIRFGNATGTATLKFAGADEFDEAYFIDKATNTTYDLLSTDSITVDLVKGLNADRFVVKFRLNAPIITGETETSTSGVKIYTEDNQHVVVSATDKITNITVLSANGQVILNATPQADRYAVLDLSKYPAGVYVVKATTTAETKTGKVIIK
ncbi:MAG: T9SS type A sorting domain-containing protein [Prevotellaceae bacterium]|nr:T9SS type A sorting domain-containing protein [Prevotellaceae bacterium]